jgi:hypothetical protein
VVKTTAELARDIIYGFFMGLQFSELVEGSCVNQMKLIEKDSIAWYNLIFTAYIPSNFITWVEQLRVIWDDLAISFE